MNMKTPVDHVRVSTTGREILIRIKKRTGLEHWNVICRIALCRSLANPKRPPKPIKTGESSIDMEWKTFAGPISEELTALVYLRASKDGIDFSKKEEISEYFRSHLERGISSLQNVKSLRGLVNLD